MSLETEIQERSQEISTDAYAMSIGELVSLYRDGELDIHPEFQRFFRWTPGQKSSFIESILLGIPIPSIFVSQTSGGTWEVIDGLQRISTILELMGELLGPENEKMEPLILLKTKYLPSLEGKRWEAEDSAGVNQLPSSAKLKIKRARLDIKIVLNTSDDRAKYELFQRLNTGGSLATDQEVRNCILIMVNRDFFGWLSELGKYQRFRDCIPLTERAVEEQFDLELLIRFLVLRRVDASRTSQIAELGVFLTDRAMELANSSAEDLAREKSAFCRTFDLLAEALGEDSFKKFDTAKGKPTGSILISVFEVMALGLGYHAEFGTLPDAGRVKAVHQGLWSRAEFTRPTGSGIRASTRIPVTIPLGRRLFGDENSVG